MGSLAIHYLRLDAKISEFARTQVYAVDIMQNELQSIADILAFLEQAERRSPHPTVEPCHPRRRSRPARRRG
jgi:hypothetical protein